MYVRIDLKYCQVKNYSNAVFCYKEPFSIMLYNIYNFFKVLPWSLISLYSP